MLGSTPTRKYNFLLFISRFIAMLTICHLPSATDQKRTSRRELRSRCFCEFSAWAMHKIDNPYGVSVFSLKNHHPFSMVFAWLWGYEFAVPLMFSIHVQHTRLKKTDFFASARGGQVSQLVQRVCVAAVCATNKRKHLVSDGSKFISRVSLCLLHSSLGTFFFKRDCHFLSIHCMKHETCLQVQEKKS